jgi:hypothetical protein
LYTGQAESTVQRSSGESGAGSDVGNEQPNTSTVNLVNRVRESDASISGSIPESEGQKVDLVHYMGVLFLLLS